MSNVGTDYRHIIKAEYERRHTRNGNYSMRAYARDLQLSPSKLSEILRHKKGLSYQSAVVIAKKLHLGNRESEQFVLLVQASHARSALAREQAQKKLKQIQSSFSFSQMNMDAFETIANWVHFAVMELTEIKDFQPSLSWIAKRLGIDKDAAKSAVKRLQRLGLIEKSTEGKWVQTERDLATPDTMASRAVKNHHFQILKKADAALEEVPMEFREFSSTMMGIDVNKLPEAKEALKEFRRRFCKDVQDTDNKNSLYCLSMQFFPLDWQKENQKRNET
ncbi:DUF4423 domain-containing protein [Bdellovibrio sp. HCB337]|uniref:DUF4423 domain-containing protein n=1 Tax=Bdellovibrio sp. HCB337 TaxID=3394358 RepID=UPI0039A43E20